MQHTFNACIINTLADQKYSNTIVASPGPGVCVCAMICRHAHYIIVIGLEIAQFNAHAQILCVLYIERDCHGVTLSIAC